MAGSHRGRSEPVSARTRPYGRAPRRRVRLLLSAGRARLFVMCGGPLDERGIPRMTPDEAFLQAIRECPADDTPRLIYSDWLEERGDAASRRNPSSSACSSPCAVCRPRTRCGLSWRNANASYAWRMRRRGYRRCTDGAALSAASSAVDSWKRSRSAWSSSPVMRRHCSPSCRFRKSRSQRLTDRSIRMCSRRSWPHPCWGS